MTRINRPDTLLTQLRDLNRRLRLLEAVRIRSPQAGSAALGPVGPSGDRPGAAPDVGQPLLPARPADWPGTASPDWDRLVVTWLVGTGRPARLSTHLAADPGTAGEVRVVVSGSPVGDPFTAAGTPERVGVDVPAELLPDGLEVEIAVEARRTEGPGLVRAVATLA